MSLISGASLFAGNDSGPAHIAAAFSVPLLVLYGRPEHASIWAPWQAPAAQTLSSPNGITAITTAAAIQALDRLP
jgi:ADP-heptose:LPS heptosyltransferase